MALIIEIHVRPSSKKTEWYFDKNSILKCSLKSPPIEGKANKELIKTIAKNLKIPQHLIEIIQGLASKKKVLKIHTVLTFEQFLQALSIEKQTTIFT